MAITVKEVHVYDSFEDLMYNCWSGAIETLKEIEKHGKEDEFMDYLETYFMDYDEVEITELNDYIWFEDDEIFDYLGIEYGVYGNDDEEDEEDWEDENYE